MLKRLCGPSDCLQPSFDNLSTRYLEVERRLVMGVEPEDFTGTIDASAAFIFEPAYFGKTVELDKGAIISPEGLRHKRIRLTDMGLTQIPHFEVSMTDAQGKVLTGDGVGLWAPRLTCACSTGFRLNVTQLTAIPVRSFYVRVDVPLNTLPPASGTISVRRPQMPVIATANFNNSRTLIDLQQLSGAIIVLYPVPEESFYLLNFKITKDLPAPAPGTVVPIVLGISSSFITMW